MIKYKFPLTGLFICLEAVPLKVGVQDEVPMAHQQYSSLVFMEFEKTE